MKKLLIKTGEYTNANGEIKGRYLNLGVIMQGKNGGEYALLDPSIDLAGALLKQNIAREENRDSLMVSIFENEQKGDYKNINQDLNRDEVPF